jgi:uncharacterized protein (DUF2236 family)
MTPRTSSRLSTKFALPLVQGVKRTISKEVRAAFSDRPRGEKPTVRRGDGLFGPTSVVRRVHGDVTTMMAGGIAALLLQMLHPAVLAGVWDHSNFREDMLGRLRRTARFIAVTTYGDRDEAEAAVARVRTIHDRVCGRLPDGTPYAANDPRLLAWVHVTETTNFLDAWIRYGDPRMSVVDQDRYFFEMARLGEALGADPVPRNRADAQRLIATMRGELSCDRRTQTVARLVLEQPARNLASAPFQALTIRAGVDLLPDWARRMHGLSEPTLTTPLVRAVAFGLAETIRWAMK